MSAITKPILLDETGQALLAAEHRRNALLEILASDKIATLTTNLNEIHQLVREGIASQVLAIGDQINVAWSDGTNDYTMPMDIVHFGDVELQDGETVPGMWLQCHYCTPFGVQFDNAEAFYVCESALPAGTYHVTLATTWSKATAGTYQFTLTQEVPAGGVLAGFERMPDVLPENWTVKSYTSPSAASPIETVAVTSGTEGTDLGTMASTTVGTLNSMQRTGYGYNRWSQSGIRQWLNSKAAAGAWWTSQNDFDMPPTELASKQGFMAGFSDEFLNILGKVKVTTALNTVEGLGDTSEDTYDTFFLPSLEQMYGTPQLSGVEGDYWEYWKRALGLTSPAGTGSANANEAYKTYAINAQTSAQNVRLRSAYRGYAYITWNVYASGYLYTTYAWYSLRCAPACVIV